MTSRDFTLTDLMVAAGEAAVQIENPQEHDEGVSKEEEDEITAVKRREDSETEHPVTDKEYLVESNTQQAHCRLIEGFLGGGVFKIFPCV